MPLRSERSLSAPAAGESGQRLSELRRILARMQAPDVALEAPRETPLGVAAIDRALGGGLMHGALHEIAARDETHIAAAIGFALGLAASLSFRDAGEARESGIHSLPYPPPLAGEGRVGAAYGFRVRPFGASRNDSGKSVLWVAEDMALLESGVPYGPGLDDHGLKPEQLLTVAGAKAEDVLWAMEEALHCRAIGMAIGEIRSPSRELDLVATRRLSLAAANHGALALLLRTMPGAEASAAATRWVVGASPSPSCPRLARASTSFLNSSFKNVDGRDKPGHDAIGPPRFDLTLVRNRRGPTGSWTMEWSLVDASFVLATHPQPVARAPIDRPDRVRAA